MLANLLIIAYFTSFTVAQLRVLYQNDLSATVATSALLLGDLTSGTNVSAACAVYNERPLASVTSGVQDQLNYLVFAGRLPNSSQLWFAGTNSTVSTSSRLFKRQSGTCSAYLVGNHSEVNVPCSLSLGVLCTNSAPPFSANNTSPAPGSLVTARGNGTSFNGFRDARSLRFLGVPFASPPTGILRFQAATPYNRSYANINATAYSLPCIQIPNIFGVANGTAMSEDCLYLNIFTPALPSSGRNASSLLPVAFWMHGGSFQEGAGSLPDYDGGNMASRGDVVVVTINYRLGILGNMASSTLAGSQGTTDQIQALKWVQQYISIFGGDPSKVTIFGQSAGGQSVYALLSSTPAKGLFARAISESGAWWPFVTRAVYTGPGGMYPALLNSTNCTQSDAAGQLQCLQAVPAQDFTGRVYQAVTNASVGAQRAYSGVGPAISETEPVLPVIGTGVIDGLFPNLILNGTLPNAGVQWMASDNRNEGALFVDAIPDLMRPVNFSTTALQQLLPSAFDNKTSAVMLSNLTFFGMNSSDPDDFRDLVSQYVTLEYWQCPLQQVLGYAYNQKSFSSLYTCRFDMGLAQNLFEPDACYAGAPSGTQSICHASEVLEVFGNSNVKGYPYNANNSLVFAQYTVDVWTAFMRTGNPQPNLAYLTARGNAYNATVANAQASTFSAFNPNATNAIHLMTVPPSNSPLVFQPQCAALAAVPFNYARVSST